MEPALHALGRGGNDVWNEAAIGSEDPPGVILSTHRDIVCDPALYNLARVEAGLDTTHIVLGTNLAGIPG